MATFNEMVDEVLLRLSGFGLRNDAVTHLVSSITSSATTLTINNTESIGRGIIEIDDELIWVDSFDRNTGVVTIAPYGRGYLGTTAASHSANARVVINPSFSRAAVKRDINDTIKAIFPEIFAVGTYSFTSSPAVTTYSLPSAVHKILGVSYETIGSTKEWAPVRGWRLDNMAKPSAFNSNKSLTITSFIDPSSTVYVTYMSKPDVLVNNSDDFEATTGLGDSCKDVVILGACYRLLSFIDPGRATYSSAEAESQSSQVQYGSATNTAKYVYALFQQRKQEEASGLLQEYPVRVHYTN